MQNKHEIKTMFLLQTLNFESQNEDALNEFCPQKIVREQWINEWKKEWMNEWMNAFGMHA